MKCKTMLKFLLCFLIISVFCGMYFVQAAGPSASHFFDADKGKYDTVVEKLNSADDDGNKMLSPIYHIQSLIMLIGTVVAVIVVGVYGIQWMVATPAKRQELKSGMIPLILGVILLVLGPRLAMLIVNNLM